MTNFTPISALIGGGMLGLAALILLKFNGRIAGISGVINGALQSKDASGDKTWRWIFLIGLMFGPLLAMPFAERVDITLEVSWTLIIVAGFLVGLGSSLGSGCTSGHAICGMGRLSPRSIVATCIFMGTAALVVFVLKYGIGA